MRCKNCGHGIIDDQGIPKHIRDNGGAGAECDLCSCVAPERCSPPVLCLNCGVEVKRKKGVWHHVIVDDYTAGGLPLRVGYTIRRLVIDNRMGCDNPQGA